MSVFTALGLDKLGKKARFEKLYEMNRWAAGLHAAQGVLVLVLSDPHRGLQPITTGYLTVDSLATSTNTQPALVGAVHHLFDLNLAYLVAAFFFMSAIAHLLVATRYRKKYEADLKKGTNPARWIEYAFSASTMMVGISLLSGIYDLSTLLLIFGLTAIMSLMGLAMEIYNKGAKRPNWLAYIIGVKAGALPWLAVIVYMIGAQVYGSGIPAFVYFIYLSLFVLFASFAVNMYLQYAKVGKWADYLYGEKVYIILSLVAKSALAWQVFAGALR